MFSYHMDIPSCGILMLYSWLRSPNPTLMSTCNMSIKQVCKSWFSLKYLNIQTKKDYLKVCSCFPSEGIFLSEFQYKWLIPQSLCGTTKYPQHKFNFRDLFAKVFCFHGRCGNMYIAQCELGFGWLSHTFVQF